MDDMEDFIERRELYRIKQYEAIAGLNLSIKNWQARKLAEIAAYDEEIERQERHNQDELWGAFA